MMLMTKRIRLHDQENGLCPCLRLTDVKMIHDTKHILELQVCLCVYYICTLSTHKYTLSNK
jgi:hypothetical protein